MVVVNMSSVDSSRNLYNKQDRYDTNLMIIKQLLHALPCTTKMYTMTFSFNRSF